MPHTHHTHYARAQQHLFTRCCVDSYAARTGYTCALFAGFHTPLVAYLGNFCRLRTPHTHTRGSHALPAHGAGPLPPRFAAVAVYILSTTTTPTVQALPPCLHYPAWFLAARTGLRVPAGPCLPRLSAAPLRCLPAHSHCYTALPAPLPFCYLSLPLNARRAADTCLPSIPGRLPHGLCTTAHACYYRLPSFSYISVRDAVEP